MQDPLAAEELSHLLVDVLSAIVGTDGLEFATGLVLQEAEGGANDGDNFSLGLEWLDEGETTIVIEKGSKEEVPTNALLMRARNVHV
jgi:hypothetical protein